MEGPPNRYEPDSLQPGDIQRRLEPMGLEGLERNINRLPVCASGEMRAVGLPGTNIVRSTQVKRIQLAIATHDEAQARVAGRIEGIAQGITQGIAESFYNNFGK